MAKVSLEELRKGSVPKALPERSYQLCLRGDLLAEMDALTSRLGSILMTAEVKAGENAPKRMGEQSEPEEATEIRVRLAELYDETDDATGDLRLRALLDGKWRQWVNAHPAREDNDRDDALTYGICNADDLADELGTWVIAWNDEALADGDWGNVFDPCISGGDRKALVSLVVQMQEGRDDPKLRRLALPAARTSNATDNSPEQ